MVGQAPWKQQQRSSAFKWIKTPAQSPGPAAIGQAGCSLDEDLRLIISRAAFVFAATVACTGTCGQGERRAAWRLTPASDDARLRGQLWGAGLSTRTCSVFVSSPPSRPRYAVVGEPRIQCVTLILVVIRQHQINRVNIAALQLFSQLHCENLYLLASMLTQESILLQLVHFTLFWVYFISWQFGGHK